MSTEQAGGMRVHVVIDCEMSEVVGVFSTPEDAEAMERQLCEGRYEPCHYAYAGGFVVDAQVRESR